MRISSLCPSSRSALAQNPFQQPSPDANRPATVGFGEQGIWPLPKPDFLGLFPRGGRIFGVWGGGGSESYLSVTPIALNTPKFASTSGTLR